MEQGRKGAFVKRSPLFEVNLNKKDDYITVVSKISDTVGMKEVHGVVLLTSGGSVISGGEGQWTLGGCLTCHQRGSIWVWESWRVL